MKEYLMLIIKTLNFKNYQLSILKKFKILKPID